MPKSQGSFETYDNADNNDKLNFACKQELCHNHVNAVDCLQAKFMPIDSQSGADFENALKCPPKCPEKCDFCPK